jgi:hypothetical protein
MLDHGLSQYTLSLFLPYIRPMVSSVILLMYEHELPCD